MRVEHVAVDAVEAILQVAMLGELDLPPFFEKLGEFDAAQGHLRQLAEEYPASDMVPRALSKASMILQRAGQWGEAKQVLGDLCNLPYAHELYPHGLLELARCHAQLSEGHKGLRVLDALDAIWPLEKIDATRATRAERGR